MGTSPRSTRLLIGALVIAVVGLTIALVVSRRQPDTVATDPRATSAPPEERNQSAFSARPTLPGVPDQPPAHSRNELGQPLNEDGRPIGPPEKLAAVRNRPIAPGELPVTPPLFTDPGQRAAFKRWWVDELTRRTLIYRDLEPGPSYPPADQTARLLDELYDTAEPRRPGESAEEAYERRKRWHELWKEFLDGHGATVYTVVTRGGDPQHGSTPPPPVLPSGEADSDVPPAEPASESPPEGGQARDRRPEGDER